jgi:hypothetical protein
MQIFQLLNMNINQNIKLLTKEDFLEAFRLFEFEKASFPGSLYYDLLWEGKRYPPKSILALAYKVHFGELIPNKQFNQGEKSLEFQIIRNLGFQIVKKEFHLPFQIAAYHFSSFQSSKNQLNYSYDKENYIWSGDAFKKLNIDDYVVWIDGKSEAAFFTKLISQTIDINDVFQFKIIGKARLPESWLLNNRNVYLTDTEENLLVLGTKTPELKNKIKKLAEIANLFDDNQEVSKIIAQAVELLQEKNNFYSHEPSVQDFKDYMSRFDQIEINTFISTLKFYLSKLNIGFGDKRVTYNYYNNGFYFTIGKRYSLVYKPDHPDSKFLVICTQSVGITEKDTTFDGQPIAYLCRRNDLNFTAPEQDLVLNAMQKELNRTEKSTYRKSSKINFESFLFDQDLLVRYDILINGFSSDAIKQDLIFSSILIKRYIASLATKPFVIFTGLSGSGKTKLTQTFAKWICESDQQYKIIPVGADWTNREPLLGYPNSLDPSKYVLPDNGALDLILAAIEDAKDKELKDCKPFFLILDEMNLSHVERYFADFLSGMESKEAISLYTGNDRKDENGRIIPKDINLPPNLFLVGTVNVDETTYMFSPKVLDRANTIEFRIEKDDIIRFFDVKDNQPIDVIDGKGFTYSGDLMAFVSEQSEQSNPYQKQLLEFFKALQPIGAEFGYRTANEMNRLISFLEIFGLEKSESALDVAVMQKLLPKLHGSRTKLNKVLPILASFCFKSCTTDQAKTFLDEFKQEGKLKSETKPILPLSFTKIARMYAAAQENGFASYAEG